MRLRIALGLMLETLLGVGPVAVRGAITTPCLPTTAQTSRRVFVTNTAKLVAHSRAHDVNLVAVDLSRDGLDVRLSQANGDHPAGRYCADVESRQPAPAADGLCSAGARLGVRAQSRVIGQVVIAAGSELGSAGHALAHVAGLLKRALLGDILDIG